MNYDIIGDIHGHAGALTALLRDLGYRHRGGAWRHPDRRAIFVVDFIDWQWPLLCRVCSLRMSSLCYP